MCIVNYKYVVNIVLFIEGLLSSLTGNFCCRMGAKNAFEKMGKIPNMKELNAEYGELLSLKKRLYSEYR